MCFFRMILQKAVIQYNTFKVACGEPNANLQFISACLMIIYKNYSQPYFAFIK